MAPIIAITARLRALPGLPVEGEAHTVNREYVDAVAAAGGIPLVVTPLHAGAVDSVLDRVDGIVLTGGGDVDPAAWGGTVDETNYGIDPARDEFEFAVVERARQRTLPTLAICRGLQVVNVALGGSLIGDIPTRLGSTDHAIVGPGARTGHQEVRLEPGCLVAEAVGVDTVTVNSIHHQAVDTLGDGLRAVGWAADGIVEAVEHEDGEWLLYAVQWHPEYLFATDPVSKRLFDAFVAAAAGD